jgi:hypothetical protein
MYCGEIQKYAATMPSGRFFLQKVFALVHKENTHQHENVTPDGSMLTIGDQGGRCPWRW